MKKIIFICTLLVSLFAMSGCSDDIDTPVLTTDEYPRILGRWPDKQEDGTLGKFSIPLNHVLHPSTFLNRYRQTLPDRNSL